jgi:tRNA (guanine37-N1)-methyltransferase
MQIDVFTLFPHWFAWFETQRHVVNARAHGHELQLVDYRDFTTLSGRQVDDAPFGGGAGMVLRVDVVDAAIAGHYGRDSQEVRAERRIVALTPSGRMLDEELVAELAEEPALTLLCGRYEGFDERIVDHIATDAISIGRYVLAGGELAAMVVCDTVLRRLPGALGDERSPVEESFSAALEGAPEYPHYTRPAEYRGWRVPEVLLSGHHERIREWRMERSRERAEASDRATGEGSRSDSAYEGGHQTGDATRQGDAPSREGAQRGERPLP